MKRTGNGVVDLLEAGEEGNQEERDLGKGKTKSARVVERKESKVFGEGKK